MCRRGHVMHLRARTLLVRAPFCFIVKFVSRPLKLRCQAPKMQKKEVASKKILEEQQAIGAIYKQYIDTFQETSEIPRKTFVKSATLYADEEKSVENEKGQLYNPKPILKCRREALQDTPRPPGKRSKCESKKKSNLKSLGDELKLLQHERGKKEQHHHHHHQVKAESLSACAAASSGIYDNEYTNSTNLFVSNLAQSVTESNLIEIFGEFGPLASVKIMWPRKQEVSRNVNCGFVAFMSRNDAERALNGLKKREDMRINWGKSVKIPPFPVHVPEKLHKMYAPPPPSGLPFSAQATSSCELSETVVKVTIPFDRNQLMLIHRMVEFVVREGPEFEALIAKIEEDNPDYAFLRDFQSPSHTYYRWRLFSILNGEQKTSWRSAPFRMYAQGSVWMPPTAPNYCSGMPPELVEAPDAANDESFPDEERVKLVNLIRNLTMARDSISEAMFFCLSHSECINDVLEVLLDSFKSPTASPLKKLARLYLLSDVLVNLIRTKNERIEPQRWVFELFDEFHGIYADKLQFCEDRECLKRRMLKLIRAWVSLKVFDTKIVNKLEMVFLFGLGSEEEEEEEPLDGRNLLKSFATSTSDCFIVKNTAKFDIFSPRGVISFKKSC